MTETGAAIPRAWSTRGIEKLRDDWLGLAPETAIDFRSGEIVDPTITFGVTARPSQPRRLRRWTRCGATQGRGTMVVATVPISNAALTGNRDAPGLHLAIP